MLCQTPASRKMIIELLDRFYYIRDDSLKLHLQRCQDKIENDWRFRGETTLVAAMHNDDDADSSQLIVQMLKAQFSDREAWAPSHFYNSAFKAANRASLGIENIVLVDEFIGTGDQARKVLKSIKDAMLRMSIDCNIYIASMVAMKDSIEHIAPLVTDYWSSAWLSRGISDYYVGDELEEAKCNMTILEGLLSPRRGNSVLQPFGYRRSEALYKYALSTTPDNVFPVFHWKWLTGNTLRRTVLPPRAL